MELARTRGKDDSLLPYLDELVQCMIDAEGKRISIFQMNVSIVDDIFRNLGKCLTKRFCGSATSGNQTTLNQPHGWTCSNCADSSTPESDHIMLARPSPSPCPSSDHERTSQAGVKCSHRIWNHWC